MATVPALVQRLEYAVVAEPDRIIVDLAATSFMDSSGLHAIAHAANVLPVGSALIVRCPRPFLANAMRILQLDRVCGARGVENGERSR